MIKNGITRRNFISKTTAGFAGAAVPSGLAPGLAGGGDKKELTANVRYPAGSFASEVKRLPPEEIYDFHKRLSTGPVHLPNRNRKLQPVENEMHIPDDGWKIFRIKGKSIVTDNAVDDFRDYLEVSQNVKVEAEGLESLDGWKDLKNCIVVGTREQLPGCGARLKASKDYELKVAQDQVVVCGYDDLGAMHGLYNLEARMNLREAPYLPLNLNTVRHSLFDRRIVFSWMGWMEFQDPLLCHLAHDGFDGIYAGALTNPNGDRTTAESSTDFYARILFKVRLQDPAIIRDLINRAAKYGIKVYTPICWQYLGTREDEEGLRRLVREIVKQFPDIKGYILLTEGFWYDGWRSTKDDEWISNWSKAIGIVEEECHKAVRLLVWLVH